MNKKRAICIGVVLLALVCGLLIFININSKNTSGNASRRDGEGEAYSDEDLLAVDGSSSFADGSNSSIYSSTSEGPSILDGSLIGGDVNQPIVSEVEKVRRIVISEAITINEGDSGKFYSNEDFLEVIPADIASFSATEIPKAYDSRNVEGKRYVSSVEDQGYSYLCWAFASMGAIESDILRHNEDIDYKDINLSEKHLAYYNVHKAEDNAYGDIEEDYRELVNADGEEGAWIFDYDSGYVAVGGVTDFCISLLTAWKGPVSDIDNDSFDALYGQEYLFKENTKIPSNAYNSEYHVQDVAEVVCSVNNNEYVKQMIMEHGAVTIGVNADNAFWSNHNQNLYSHFDGKAAPTANHEVLIVGWDDDYSASNFSSKAPGNGAWICKNSWGKNSGDGGFFYLSYYDETAGSSNAAAYTVAEKKSDNWFDNNYQVAGFLTNTVSTLDDAKNYVVALSSSKNPYGVLYTAKGNEILSAIGLMAIDSYQQYEADIYINPKVSDGKLVFEELGAPDYSQKISAISGGYHTFKLDQEIKLHGKDSFFVLIRPVTSGRLVIEEQCDEISGPNYDEWNNLTGNFHNYYNASNQSYYISDDGLGMEVQTDKDFFVKAYTVAN